MRRFGSSAHADRGLIGAGRRVVQSGRGAIRLPRGGRIPRVSRHESAALGPAYRRRRIPFMTSWPMPLVRFSALPAACAAALLLQPGCRPRRGPAERPVDLSRADDQPRRARLEPVVGALCRHGDLRLGRQGGQRRGRRRGLSRLRSRLRQRRRRRGPGVERLRALPVGDAERLLAVHRDSLRRRVGRRRLPDGATDPLRDRRRRPRPSDPLRLASAPLDNVNAVFSGPGAVQAVGTVGVGAIYQLQQQFQLRRRGAHAHEHRPGAWGSPY